MGGTHRPRIERAAVVAALALAAACGGGAAGGESGLRALTGEVIVDGSSTVQPITAAVAEEFKAAGAAGVKVAVGTSGTGGGFKKFCNGETDISDASRPIEDDEVKACAAKGVAYVELPVAVDGLSVVVNPQNHFVDCLTVAELKRIWEPGSAVRRWSQVRAGFPDRPLTLYGPGTDSGTFDYFTAQIVGEEGASRSDYTASEDDNVLVQGIAGDPDALGYFGYAYVAQNRDRVKVIGVDGGSGCVTPNDTTINDGSYRPLSRPLYIYVARSSIAKPQVKAFVDFYLAEVNRLLPSVGYVPLHPSDLAASRRAWAAVAG